MERKTGFTPLETIGRQRKDLMSLTGFTLIEVLVAIFLLGFGIVTFFNLFPIGLQSLSYARKLNEVYFLAGKKLEELKLHPEIESQEVSGQEKDLHWTISTKPLEISEGIVVTHTQLEIDYNFLGKPQKQRFVTYLATNP